MRYFEDKWIVFWWREGRVGSVEYNDANWEEINSSFIYQTIQTDITGTEHIEILGIKGAQWDHKNTSRK
jgi:hypothetical protein